MKISDYIIECKEPILAAMKKIDKNTKGTIYVVENKKVVGVVTDGDIRRYILLGEI